jgi:hypothetical protein
MKFNGDDIDKIILPNEEEEILVQPYFGDDDYLDYNSYFLLHGKDRPATNIDTPIYKKSKDDGKEIRCEFDSTLQKLEDEIELSADFITERKRNFFLKRVDSIWSYIWSANMSKRNTQKLEKMIYNLEKEVNTIIGDIKEGSIK